MHSELNIRIKSSEFKKKLNIKDGEPGAPGFSPVKGIDYNDGLNGKDGVDGKDGKDGLNGKDGLDGLDGPKGEDGKDGKDGVDAIVQKEEIVTVINPLLDFNLLKNRPEWSPRMGGTGYLREITDVAITNPQVGQNLEWNGTKWVNSTDDTGTINGTSSQFLKADGSVDSTTYLDTTTAGTTYLKLNQGTPQTITASPVLNWGTSTRIPYYSGTKTLTDSSKLTFADVATPYTETPFGYYGNVANVPVDAGSVTGDYTGGSLAFLDDGGGNLIDSYSLVPIGTIDYSGGSWSISSYDTVTSMSYTVTVTTLTADATVSAKNLSVGGGNATIAQNGALNLFSGMVNIVNLFGNVQFQCTATGGGGAILGLFGSGGRNFQLQGGGSSSGSQGFSLYNVNDTSYSTGWIPFKVFDNNNIRMGTLIQGGGYPGVSGADNGTPIQFVGNSTLEGSLKITKTTEQQRTEYNSTNYYTTTVGSTGGVTFNAVGTGANFTFSDSINFPYIAQTANYTLTTTDYLVNCTANTFTVTLPTAVGVTGRVYNIKNSGTGVITVATTSSQTIDGITTQTLIQYACITVQSNGANWVITNRM